MSSLCILVQRLGRAGRNPSIEARGVYFIENDHFDAARDAKVACKRKREEGRGKAKGNKKCRVESTTTQSQSEAAIMGVVVEDGSSSESDDDSDAEGSGNTVMMPIKKTLPSRAGMSNKAYDLIVMDHFINSASRGHCPRGIMDEYFENNCARKFWSVFQLYISYLICLFI